MSINPESLARTYRDLDEQRLIKMAVYEAAQLSPIAVQALKSEISRRNLSPHLFDAIDIQNALPNSPEALALFDWFQTSPCPRCGTIGGPLNAYVVGQTGSSIMAAFTGIKMAGQFILGCPACISSALGAEWKRKERALDEPTKEFIKYFQDNRGAIMMLRRHAEQGA